LIDPPADHLRGSYIKFTTGSSEERPCAGIAVLLNMQKNVCAELRLVVGAVSPKPIRVRTGEEMAGGARLTDDLIQRIAVDASGNIDPVDDLRAPADYKRHLVRVLVARALRAAVQV
jgi:aerobic carbon-monoxide dehydrogenase medium subunit